MTSVSFRGCILIHFLSKNHHVLSGLVKFGPCGGDLMHFVPHSSFQFSSPHGRSLFKEN